MKSCRENEHSPLEIKKQPVLRRQINTPAPSNLYSADISYLPSTRSEVFLIKKNVFKSKKLVHC